MFLSFLLMQFLAFDVLKKDSIVVDTGIPLNTEQPAINILFSCLYQALSQRIIREHWGRHGGKKKLSCR